MKRPEEMAADGNPLVQMVLPMAELMGWLRDKGEGYGAAFENMNAIRTALDRTHVRHDAKIEGAREIAFFPPMTGG